MESGRSKDVVMVAVFAKSQGTCTRARGGQKPTNEGRGPLTRRPKRKHTYTHSLHTGLRRQKEAPKTNPVGTDSSPQKARKNVIPGNKHVQTPGAPAREGETHNRGSRRKRKESTHPV